MVSFDTKSYSKKLLHLISWSHWFTFFNIIAAVTLSSYYLFSETAPDTLLGQVYLVTTLISHIAFLTFMSFVLILFPLTIVWPNTKVIRTSGSIIFTFGLLLLILDGFIYSRLGYHLNASSAPQAIALIKEIAKKSDSFLVITGLVALVILACEFTVSNYAWKHLKQLQKTIFARFVVFGLVLAFFFSHLTHIWADANLNYDVLRQDTTLPLSYPSTAKTLLTKYGLFNKEDYIERKTSPLAFSSAIPNYPIISKEQCPSVSTKKSVFVVVTDQLLSEQQLQQFARRISAANYQLNNHIDTAEHDESWFNLFYSLPSIYKKDILAQQTKPLLFQAIEQEKLASSYTLITKKDTNYNDNIGNKNSDAFWFDDLFNTKTQLNDISSLVFANKLNSKNVGLHLVYFKSTPNENPKNSHTRYQFELFVEALLLAQQQKQNKDIIWISSLGNQHQDTRLTVKPAIFILPNDIDDKAKAVSRLSSHMDLQPTLMTHWLGCNVERKSYSNGADLLSLNKDRVIANTSSEGLMVFNKDKSIFIDQKGNFESYSSHLAAPITVNQDFPLMIDGVHLIKQFSLQAEQK